MHYFIVAYLTLGIFAAQLCIRYNRRHGVESNFTWEGISNMLAGAADPMALLLAIPFAIACWPLLCLWDILEIPGKKRNQIQQKKQALNHLKIKMAANNSVATATDDHQTFIDKNGVAIGALSPMGKIRIDNEVYEATSRDGYISKGCKVVVTGLRGSTLEVAVLDEIRES